MLILIMNVGNTPQLVGGSRERYLFSVICTKIVFLSIMNVGNTYHSAITEPVSLSQQKTDYCHAVLRLLHYWKF